MSRLAIAFNRRQPFSIHPPWVSFACGDGNEPPGSSFYSTTLFRAEQPTQRISRPPKIGTPPTQVQFRDLIAGRTRAAHNRGLITEADHL